MAARICPFFSLIFVVLQLRFTRIASFKPAAATVIPPVAIQALSDAGYVSMALTLEIASRTLQSSTSASLYSSSATVFSPSDAAFSSIGQPCLSLLQYHVCPARLTPGSLRSLPYASRIPTLAPNCTLTLTSLPSPRSSVAPVSLNGVNVYASTPIYDDGRLIVYATDSFFDPEFKIRSAASGTVVCRAAVPPRPFAAAVVGMSNRGFSGMAAFLDMQLGGGGHGSKGGDGGDGDDNALLLTVFAPVDAALENCGDGGFKGFASLLRAHVVPCRLTMEELLGMRKGAILPTLLEGFAVEVGRTNGTVLINGVPVHAADVYVDDFLVVHGVRQLLEAPGSVSIDFGSGSRYGGGGGAGPGGGGGG